MVEPVAKRSIVNKSGSSTLTNSETNTSENMFPTKLNPKENSTGLTVETRECCDSETESKIESTPNVKPTEPKITKYIVQLGESEEILVRKSLDAQGIKNPDAKTLEEAAKKFRANNFGLIGHNKKGAEFLIAGKTANLEGEIDTSKNKSAKEVDQTWAQSHGQSKTKNPFTSIHQKAVESGHNKVVTQKQVEPEHKSKQAEKSQHPDTTKHIDKAQTTGKVTKIDSTKSSVLNKNASKLKNSFGHLPYKEADTSTLKVLHSNNGIKGNKEAVNSLEKMIKDAQNDGVNIGIISGFRSINQQTHLFYGIAKQRHQTLEKRAKTSAPPGYSEHHTGYAFDLSAQSNLKTKLSKRFGDTAEFRWMEKNAAKYGFELSFPKNNKQGVSYEPWHWRYVGNERSKEIFKTAREHL